VRRIGTSWQTYKHKSCLYFLQFLVQDRVHVRNARGENQEVGKKEEVHQACSLARHRRDCVSVRASLFDEALSLFSIWRLNEALVAPMRTTYCLPISISLLHLQSRDAVTQRRRNFFEHLFRSLQIGSISVQKHQCFHKVSIPLLLSRSPLSLSLPLSRIIRNQRCGSYIN